MYPDHVIGPGNSGDYVGESCVHSLVSLPRTFAVFRIEREVVEEGPDGLVADTVVVGLDILL